MKKILVLLVTLFFMTACKTDTLSIYQEYIDIFYSRNNYRIIENIDGFETIYEYSGTTSHIKSEEEEYYISIEDDKTYLYMEDENTGVFVKKEVDNNERYFYAYKIVERLNKIKYYAINDMLVSDKSGFKSKGELKGQYLYNEKIHKPKEIIIICEDGVIVSFEEKYSDNKTDYLEFVNYGTCNIELPKSYIHFEDIEKE